MSVKGVMKQVYRNINTGRRWFSNDRPDERTGVLTISPVGGGFQREINEQEFNSEFRKEQSTDFQYRSALFSVDLFPGQLFEGYHNNERHMGWAYPFFPKQAMLRLVQFTHSDEYPCLFDESSQCVKYWVNGIDSDPEIYPAVRITVDAVRFDAWPVGQESWRWSLGAPGEDPESGLSIEMDSGSDQ